jgi:hypothetical protein
MAHMSETPIPPLAIEAQTRTRYKRRRRWLTLLVLFALAAAAAVGFYKYSHYLGERDLEEAIAETDRLDPWWRREEMEKRRFMPPEDNNAALHINAAAALLGSWSPPKTTNVPPQRQLDPKHVEALRKTVQPLLPAAVLARKALPLKTGRYALAVPPDNHNQKVLTVGRFLGQLGTLQIQDGDFDEAWQTTLTIIATGRSFGDEPTLMAAIVRQSLWLLSVQGIERCLAQGRVSDRLLAEAQQALAEETAQPLMHYAFRGERAAIHIWMYDLELGKVDLASVMFSGGSNASPPIKAFMFITGSNYPSEHARMLRFFNEMAEAVKFPPAEMLTKVQDLEKRYQGFMPRLTDSMISPVYEGICEAAIGARATMECAIAGLGVERFRLQNGRWPDSLEEVVAAKFLEKMPPVGYDGLPMNYRKTTDGVVLSANAPNKSARPFRLWDENQRHQPPQ